MSGDADHACSDNCSCDKCSCCDHIHPLHARTHALRASRCGHKHMTLCRENRFLLEERDLMQQQLQQLAERSPSRQLTAGIGTQGGETPFGTPCTRGAAAPNFCCRADAS